MGMCLAVCMRAFVFFFSPYFYTSSSSFESWIYSLCSYGEHKHMCVRFLLGCIRTVHRKSVFSILFGDMVFGILTIKLINWRYRLKLFLRPKFDGILTLCIHFEYIYLTYAHKYSFLMYVYIHLLVRKSLFVAAALLRLSYTHFGMLMLLFCGSNDVETRRMFFGYSIQSIS